MRRWHYFFFSLLFVLTDQWSKKKVSGLLELSEVWTINSFLNFSLVHNPGAAFGILSKSGGLQVWFLVAVGIVACLIFAIWLWRTHSMHWIQGVALSLLFGGGLGNLIDRVRFGYVVDFISLHYQEFYWPNFNLADLFLIIGVMLFLCIELRRL